jgi:hypothetical protein
MTAKPTSIKLTGGKSGGCKSKAIDEVWAFCYTKAKNAPKKRRVVRAGDAWT